MIETKECEPEDNQNRKHKCQTEGMGRDCYRTNSVCESRREHHYLAEVDTVKELQTNQTQDRRAGENDVKQRAWVQKKFVESWLS